MNQPNRLDNKGLVDRSKPIRFRFNGRTIYGYEGDTIASALLANGIGLVGRSFKYHRPRGIVGAGAEEPNAIVQVGLGARSVPNVRATQADAVNGQTVKSVNVFPSVSLDAGSLLGLASKLMPAGFYYKTFMAPAKLWHFYEQVIRRGAGLGTIPKEPDPDRYEHINHHCDVLVVGMGVAGMAAALAAARSGARVMLCDEQNQPGGYAINSRETLDGVAAHKWVDQCMAELVSMENVQVLLRTTAFGLHDNNFATLVERCTDHLPIPPQRSIREKYHRVRAKQIVLATGAVERSLVFSNNDRVGVMIASAVSAYINRFGVLPGREAVVFTNNDSAYDTALDLLENGARCSVIDCRAAPPTALIEAVEAAGGSVMIGAVVYDCRSRIPGGQVFEAVIGQLDDDGEGVTHMKNLPCDLIAMSGGHNPVVHLYAHAGRKPVFSDELITFVPGDAYANQLYAGSINGVWDTEQCLTQGEKAGSSAAQACSFKAQSISMPKVGHRISGRLMPMWVVPYAHDRANPPKQFVDFQNDTAAADLRLAVREGYRSIEHVKRYTLLGFGTDQGKLGNINGMAIVAKALNQSLAETGTTTFRPCYTPQTFGAIAGREKGAFFDPVRKTCIHPWHAANGAEFEDVGQWKRPWFYPRDGEDMDAAVRRECLATRDSVGILDATTLGKIDVRGPDAREFLNLVYSNNWDSLKPGHCRYGLMLGEDGMVMDDGVTACLAENHFHMTTTTGGAAGVMSHLERWLQTEWPQMRVYLTSVTDQWAAISLAGPKARAVLERVCEGVDLSHDAFPFMAWREGNIAGVNGRIFRISFSGELGYEVNVPANYGLIVWGALMEAGREFNITPYGTETLHVLRAEKGFIIVGQDTDGSVTPHDLGMGWAVSKKKDFIGRRSLSRSDCVRPNRKQFVGLKSQTVLPEGAQLVNTMSATTPVPMEGHVSSSYWSPTLEAPIALALVKGGLDRMGETVLSPQPDGTIIECEIVSPVFYDAEGRRNNG